MTESRQIRDDATAAVVGASGGIGAAMTRLLADSGRFRQVWALSRSAAGFDNDRITSRELDFDSATSIESAAEAIADDGPLDFVFVATGILHRGDDIQPEKAMRDIDARQLAQVFATNTIGPALVARSFLPLMRPKARSVFAALSARVGSIGDNRLGGWVAYRSSKAALNMILKTLSIEQSRKRPESIVVALHPGTVATDLSGPFTDNVPDNKIFTPEKAAGQLLDVIDGLGPDDTGGFFAWDGKAIPW